MDLSLRTRTTLVCGALALAIAASTLLRGRVRPVHFLFAAFSVDVGLWYLSQSLYGFFQAPIWQRFTFVLAVLLPQFALHLFEVNEILNLTRCPSANHRVRLSSKLPDSDGVWTGL